tara:strand:+ start:438 stop:1382 length:945 start_codon:yes stop_codon:yes gene_type:complete
MKIIKKLMLVKMLVFMFMSCVFIKFAAAVESRIIVKINNSIITNIDVLREEKYLILLNPNLSSLDKNKINNVAKASLIKEKIKQIAISENSFKQIDNAYLENVLESIYKKINIKNKDEFLEYIEKADLTYEEIISKLRIEAEWNQIIINKFLSELKIDKEEVKKEILLTENKKTTSYLLYEILYHAESKEKIQELGVNIKKSLKDNGFENTASIYSISQSSKSGGKLGWINEKSVNKKILNKISTLELGEVSDPIIIPGGVLLLLVKDKKVVESKMDINKELSRRINDLKNQQLNQFSNIYFLKIKKNIIINEK